MSVFRSAAQALVVLGVAALDSRVAEVEAPELDSGGGLTPP